MLVICIMYVVHMQCSQIICRHANSTKDRETFFYESLQKWHELNCTQHFGKVFDILCTYIL